MKGLEKRIEKLEEEAGITEEEELLIFVLNFLNGNPDCPASKGDIDTRCIRFREFCQKPQVNENGFAFFFLRCDGCEGVTNDY